MVQLMLLKSIRWLMSDQSPAVLSLLLIAAGYAGVEARAVSLSGIALVAALGSSLWRPMLNAGRSVSMPPDRQEVTSPSWLSRTSWQDRWISSIADLFATPCSRVALIALRRIYRSLIQRRVLKPEGTREETREKCATFCWSRFSGQCPRNGYLRRPEKADVLAWLFWRR
jgi:hypothetical protein